MPDAPDTPKQEEVTGSPKSVIKDELFETRLDSIYLAEARVYIAGVLMPVTRVTITTTFNQMPMAEIALPAYSELLYLGEYDRVPVHIFVRETMVECPEFILLFEGFISDTTYVNSALQRTVAIHAVSCFDILNDLRVQMLNQLSDFFEPSIDGAEDVSIHLPMSNINFPDYLLHYKLLPPGLADVKEGDPIRFPSDFLESIYALAQLSHPPKDVDGWKENPKLGPLHASALTAFYGAYTRAFNLLGRFARLPYFDKKALNGSYGWTDGSVEFSDDRATVFPMLYGMRVGYAIESLSKGITNQDTHGKPMTLMDLLNFLVDEMEYEYIVITNPAYHAPEEEEEKIANNTHNNESNNNNSENRGQQSESDQGGESGNNEPKPGIDEPADKRGRLVCSVLKPLLMDALPPGCNVLYRSLVNNVTVQLQHKGTPTRVRIYNAHSPLALLGAPGGQGPLKKLALLIIIHPKNILILSQMMKLAAI